MFQFQSRFFSWIISDFRNIPWKIYTNAEFGFLIVLYLDFFCNFCSNFDNIFVVIFEEIFVVGIAYMQLATLVLFYALLYKSKFQPFSQSPISKVQFQTIQMCTEKGFVEKCSSFQRFSTPVFYVSAQIVLSMQYVQCAYNYVV